VLNYPIIGLVGSPSNNLERNPWFIRNPHPGVGHQCNIKAIPLCDAINLLFDGASIRININMQQMKSLSSPQTFTAFHLTAPG